MVTEQNENNLSSISKSLSSRFVGQGIVQYKELEDNLIVKGYIATTHKDSYNDIILKETLDLWAKEINQGIPRANKATYHHDRSDVRRVGVGAKESARVEQLPDGEYGLYVDTIVNKVHPLYKEIKHEVDIGIIDSFSIEYIHPMGPKQDEGVRLLGPDTTLMGWTLASSPVNDNAVMVKELFIKSDKESKDSQEMITSHSQSSSDTESMESKEDKNMSEETNKTVQELQAQVSELKEAMAKQADLEAKAFEESKKKDEAKKKADEEAAAKKKAEEKEAQFETEFKELKNIVTELKETKVPNMVEGKEIPVEYKEFAQATASDSNYTVEEKARIAGKVLDKIGITESAEKFAKYESKEALHQDFSNVIITKEKGSGFHRVEYKSLGLGDNTNSNYVNATTEIGLSQAELQDVMMPVIFDALNSTTTTWDLLNKENYAGKGTNRVVFTLRTGRSTAYFSKSGAITQSKVGRDKFAAEFKKIYVAGAIDGDLLAASRGSPIGEALANEIADMSTDLKVKMNQALFDEVKGNKADAAPLGIPAVTDSASNTSLYDTTRTAANKLAPDAAGDTYIDASGGLTESIMRNMIEQCTTDGSQLDDLVFIGTPAVVNKYKALYDSRERLVPYSDKAGFKNAPDFEGVPVFADKDSKANSLFVIDRRGWVVAIFVPPTVEKLGKRSDSEEFFVKSYYAVVNKTPRRNAEAYSIA